MSKTFSDPLRKTLIDAINEFNQSSGFASYKIEATAPSKHPKVLAAIIGLVDDNIKGSLSILCPEVMLSKTHPNLAMEMPVGAEDIRDWVGEMANQILGRFKNKLAKIGISFGMGTPSIVEVNDLSLQHSKDQTTVDLWFNGEFGPMMVSMAVLVAPHVNFDGLNETDAAAASEGAALLF